MSKRHPRNGTGQNRAGLYDEITNRIIAELEAGRVPWVQPWGTAAAEAPLAIPNNAATILWGAVFERGFAGQSWLTFRQAIALGGHVRKGERGTTVVYADRLVPNVEKQRATESGEEALAVPFLKRFTVWNARTTNRVMQTRVRQGTRLVSLSTGIPFRRRTYRTGLRSGLVNSDQSTHSKAGICADLLLRLAASARPANELQDSRSGVFPNLVPKNGIDEFRAGPAWCWHFFRGFRF
ncbi:ArdC-like ssDNA-binding domain-containing protein [Bradyrhizobium manausense]|uniref:ArdC-like ssDNA-binding domain-containing protein n=1 Tax=Bradyrhizobium manausense TaxID=989370 RepID=UPI000A8A235B|nr:ArdC-like ssDNA-binding domain-containing protein [Bradyrhizobium manausense]